MINNDQSTFIIVLLWRCKITLLRRWCCAFNMVTNPLQYLVMDLFSSTTVWLTGSSTDSKLSTCHNCDMIDLANIFCIKNNFWVWLHTVLMFCLKTLFFKFWISIKNCKPSAKPPEKLTETDPKIRNNRKKCAFEFQVMLFSRIIFSLCTIDTNLTKVCLCQFTK